MKTILFWLVIFILGAAALLYFKPELYQRIRHFGGAAETSTTVYKWQDEHGVWHVTDTPPQDVHYQEQQYLHDTNVLPKPGDQGESKDR